MVLIWLLLFCIQHVLLCAAEDYKVISLDSSLYIFSEGWYPPGQNGVSSTAGNLSTTSGSVLFSFRGSLLTLPLSTNAQASVNLWIDGESWGAIYHNDGSMQQIRLNDTDHQAMLQVDGWNSQYWSFPGFGLPISNVTSGYYLPQTLGVQATVVPTQARILDNNDPCIKYSVGWTIDQDNNRDWMYYGTTVANSEVFNCAVTVYFLGTGVWMFGPGVSSHYPMTMDIQVDLEPSTTLDLTPTHQSIPLYQSLIWSRDNLNDTFHVVTFTIHVRDLMDVFSFDYFRAVGQDLNCASFNAVTPQGGADTALSSNQASWAIETGMLTLVFFFGVFMCICLRTRGRRRRRIFVVSSQASNSEKGDVLGSELAPAGVRILSFAEAREDPPIVVTSSPATVTPFGIVPNYPAIRQRRKEMPASPRFVPSALFEIENSGTFRSNSLSSSPIQNALLMPPEQVYREGRGAPTGLPDWTPPPPSYLTELNMPRRPFQLLSEDDLGRLVDRVTSLRATNGATKASNGPSGKDRTLLDPPQPQTEREPSLNEEEVDQVEVRVVPASSVGGEDHAQNEPEIVEELRPVDEEEDSVEVLARRIAQADRGGTGSPGESI